MGTFLDSAYRWWMDAKRELDRRLPHDRLDRFLLALSILAFVGASASLVTVISFEPYVHKARIGELGTGSNVRRREARSLKWETIAPGDPIYLRDTIKTVANAPAEIQFGNGRTLAIEPKSTVQIEDIYPRRVEVSVYRGDVERSSAVTIRSHEPLRIVPPEREPILALPQIIDPR